MSRRLRRHSRDDGDDGPEVDVEAVMAIGTVEELRRTMAEIEAVTGKSASEAGIKPSDWYRRRFGLL